MAATTLTGYPQMPPLTADELDLFLNRPLIARLGTINEDGTIHVAPIYFKYDNGTFILGTQVVSRRVRNIQRNPNVTLLIDDPNPPYKAVIIYGQASLEYEDVLEKRTAIFEKLAPPADAAARAKALCDKWESVVIRIQPERTVSFDYDKAELV
jgi:PPOX class probable F420-dependent enzyme